jgi:hypothetical protein
MGLALFQQDVLECYTIIKATLTTFKKKMRVPIFDCVKKYFHRKTLTGVKFVDIVIH